MNSILCIISCILSVATVFLARRHLFCVKVISEVRSVTPGLHNHYPIHIEHPTSGYEFIRNNDLSNITSEDLDVFANHRTLYDLVQSLFNIILYDTKERRSQYSLIHILFCCASPLFLYFKYGIISAIVFTVLFIVLLIIVFSGKVLKAPSSFRNVNTIISSSKYFVRYQGTTIDNVQDLSQLFDILSGLHDYAFNEVVLRDRLYASLCAINTIQLVLSYLII